MELIVTVWTNLRLKQYALEQRVDNKISNKVSFDVVHPLYSKLTQSVMVALQPTRPAVWTLSREVDERETERMARRRR